MENDMQIVLTETTRTSSVQEFAFQFEKTRGGKKCFLSWTINSFVFCNNDSATFAMLFLVSSDMVCFGLLA